MAATHLAQITAAGLLIMLSFQKMLRVTQRKRAEFSEGGIPSFGLSQAMSRPRSSVTELGHRLEVRRNKRYIST